jgi:hypothetical protein
MSSREHSENEESNLCNQANLEGASMLDRMEEEDAGLYRSVKKQNCEIAKLARLRLRTHFEVP